MQGFLKAAAIGFVATLAIGSAFVACDTSSSAVGPGGECFLATDCAPGLVCLEQPNKTRICSDDLSRVAGRPPPEGGNEEEGEGGMEGGRTDGPITPADSSSGNPQDTGTRDTGAE
jgi:hypothetical protein